MRRRSALLVLVVVAAACIGTRVGDALDLGATRMLNCVPVPEEGNSVFGDLFVLNTSDDPVELVSASLVDAEDLVLTATWLVNIAEGEDGVGIRHSTDTSGLPAGWTDRVRLEGATLPPGDERNLVFVVAADPEPLASARAVRIEYRLPNGRSYRQDTLSSLLVAREDCGDALDDFEF